MNSLAVLALENGSLLFGTSIGVCRDVGGEVVFNTSMTGYQEILTDPSYARQIVALTYPHIGNTGINSLDTESSSSYACALIIKDLSLVASNWRSEQKLADYLQNNNIVAIANIDTRKLTRIIRSEGSLRGWISSKPGLSKKELAEHALSCVGKVAKLSGSDLASEVSTSSGYHWQQSIWDDTTNNYPEIPTQNLKFNVVVYDFGVKHNIMRMLVSRGCRLTVVPAKTTADEILKLNPDGVLLSNGPGDPEPCSYAIEAIKKLISKNIAIFGICLGYQLLALASGAKTVKMKFGHHGVNHPVYDVSSKRVFISSQNHSFAVDKTSLPENIKATHFSLFDGSLQGIELLNSKAFGFQGHPEASPGPQELDILFDQFIEMMQN